MEPPSHTWMDREMSSVHMLWLRVWWRAVCDYVLYQNSDKRKYQRLSTEAAEWLFDEGCGCVEESCKDSRLSFAEFCRMFNRNPVTVRRWIMSLTPTDIGRMGRNLL